MTPLFAIVLSLSLSKQDILDAHTHLQLLSHDQFAGRKATSMHNALAANYIGKHFKYLGLQPLSKQFQVNFSYRSGFFTDKIGRNVIATTAINPSMPFVVISAHFDHLGTKGNKVYNGADDNASGVAALLTLAKCIKKMDNRQLNYIFLATDAEESGLFGARYFVKNSVVPLESILINVNLDMLGTSSRSRLLGLYTKPVKAFVDYLRSTSWHPNGHIKFTTGRGFFPTSVKSQRRRILSAGDHRAFYQKGIPIMYFGVGEHKYYHTVNDTYENIDHAFYNANLHNIITVIKQLDANYQLIDRR